jgi:hypothetical protein
VKFICAYCGREADKPTGAVNRSRAIGAPLYCNKRCAGLGRRKHKTKAQKVAEKRLYDMEYRRINADRMKANHRAYHLRTYDPVKAAVERKKRMPRHVEYCRRPTYKAWKREYDRRHRAKEYGPFAEVHMLLVDLQHEIASRMSGHDRRLANETYNKRLRRKREHESAIRRQS